jgi:uncharacterized membrane protein YgcG
MRRLLRTGLLVAGLAALVLFPLYGDPRPASAVSHPEWARMVLRGLGLLDDTAGVSDTAGQAFATLSGRDSRSWRADRYVRSTRVEVVDEGGTRWVRPAGGIGEAVYALGVARGGDYRLRLHVSGSRAAEAEITRAGQNEVLRAFTVPSSSVMGWIDAGTVHLDPGAYDASVLLPEGSALDFVELAPPCLEAIEPRGGWKPTAVATTEDVAVTALQALDLESELPPAASPLDFQGGDLQLEDGTRALETAAGADGTFRGGPRGARVVLLADLPESGLYTLSVFGVSSGQRWLADGCRSSLVCPSTDPAPRWRVVLSGMFAKGRHVFAAILGADTSVQRLRFEQKRDSPADYVATLQRLGLDLGPSGPVTRAKAEEARRFVERRRAQQMLELCGDILRPGTLVAELASAGSSGQGGEGGGSGGQGGGQGGGPGGGGGGPGPPPIIPPQPAPSGFLPVGFGG